MATGLSLVRMRIRNHNLAFKLLLSYIAIILISLGSMPLVRNISLSLSIALALSFIFACKTSVGYRNKLARQASDLNKMARNLEDKIGEIEIRNQHLMAVLESMVEGIIVVDKTSRIVSINAAVEKIFNIQKQ